MCAISLIVRILICDYKDLVQILTTKTFIYIGLALVETIQDTNVTQRHEQNLARKNKIIFQILIIYCTGWKFYNLFYF